MLLKDWGAFGPVILAIIFILIAQAEETSMVIEESRLSGGAIKARTRLDGGPSSRRTVLKEALSKEKSCKDLGWESPQKSDKVSFNVCGAADESGGCAASTFDTAKQSCADKGARLCTTEEVAGDVVKGTGCDINGKRVWTSTVCGENMVETLAGSAAEAKHIPHSCLATGSSNIFTVCCADNRGDRRTEQCVLSRKEESGTVIRDVDQQVDEIKSSLKLLNAEAEATVRQITNQTVEIGKLAMSRAKLGVTPRQQLLLGDQLKAAETLLQTTRRGHARKVKRVQEAELELKLTKTWARRHRNIAAKQNEAVGPIEQTVAEQRKLLRLMDQQGLGTEKDRTEIREELVALQWEITEISRKVQLEETLRYHKEDVAAGSKAARAYKLAASRAKTEQQTAEQRLATARERALGATDEASKLVLWGNVHRLSAELRIVNAVLEQLLSKQASTERVLAEAQAEIDSRAEANALTKPYMVELVQLEANAKKPEASLTDVSAVMMQVLSVKSTIREIEHDTAHSARIEAQRLLLKEAEGKITMRSEEAAEKIDPVEDANVELQRRCMTRRMRVLGDAINALKLPFAQLTLRDSMTREQRLNQAKGWKAKIKSDTAKLQTIIGPEATFTDIKTAKAMMVEIQDLQEKLNSFKKHEQSGTLALTQLKINALEMQSEEIRRAGAKLGILHFDVAKVEPEEVPKRAVLFPAKVTVEGASEDNVCGDLTPEKEDLAEQRRAVFSQVREMQAEGAELLYKGVKIGLKEASRRAVVRIRKKECMAGHDMSQRIKQTAGRVAKRQIKQMTELGSESSAKIRELLSWAAANGGEEGFGFMLVKPRMKQLGESGEKLIDMLAKASDFEITSAAGREKQTEDAENEVQASRKAKYRASKLLTRTDRKIRVLERKAKIASPGKQEEHLAEIESLRSKQIEAKQSIIKLDKIEYKAKETIHVLLNWKLVMRASRMALKASLAPFKKKLSELEVEYSKVEPNSKEADGLQEQIEDLREKISATTNTANSKLASEVNMLTQSQLAQTQLKAQRGQGDIDGLTDKLNKMKEFAAKNQITLPDLEQPATFEEELANFELKLGSSPEATQEEKPRSKLEQRKIEKKMRMFTALAKKQMHLKDKADKAQTRIEILAAESAAASAAERQTAGLAASMAEMTAPPAISLEAQAANLAAHKEAEKAAKLKQKLKEEQAAVERDIAAASQKAETAKEKEEADLLAKVRAIEEKEAKAKQELADKQAELENLEGALGASKDAVAKAEAKMKEAKAKFDELEQTLNEAKQELQREEAAGEQSQEKIAEIKQRIQQAERDLTLVNVVLDDATKDYKALFNQLNAKEEAVVAAKTKLTEISKALEEAVQQKGAATQGLQALEKQRISREEDNLKQTARKLKVAASQMKVLKLKLEACKSTPGENCDKLKAEKEKWTQMFEDRKSEINVAKAQLKLAKQEALRRGIASTGAQDEFEKVETENLSAEADLSIALAQHKNRQVNQAAKQLEVAEAQEIMARKAAADLAAKEQQLEQEKVNIEAKLAETKAMMSGTENAVRDAERAFAQAKAAYDAAESKAAQLREKVAQLRQELEECGQPSVTPVNCDDIEAALNEARIQLEQAEKEVRIAKEAKLKASVALKQAQATLTNLNDELRKSMAAVEDMAAKQAEVRQKAAAAAAQVEQAEASRTAAAKAQDAAAQAAALAQAAAKAALARANAKGACEKMEIERNRKPINEVALDKAERQCNKATKVAKVAAKVAETHKSVMEAEAKKEEAAMEVAQKKEKAKAVAAAVEEAAQQAEAVQAEVEACKAASPDDDSCEELVMKLEAVQAVVAEAKKEMEMVQAEVKAAEAKAEAAVHAAKEVKKEQENAGAHAEAVKKGKKAAAAFEAKQAKKATEEAEGALAFAQAAVRKSRKLEAVKREKVRALQTQLAQCQGGGKSAECEALEAKLGAATHELAEAETAAQFALTQAQTAQGDVDDAHDAESEANEEYDEADDEEEKEEEELEDESILERKQLGMMDLQAMFNSLKFNVTSRDFDDRMHADLELYHAQFNESDREVKRLDLELVALESETDAEVAGASQDIGGQIVEKRAMLAEDGSRMDELEHEVSKSNHKIRDLKTAIAAGSEHSTLGLRKEAAMALMVEAGAAHQTARWAKQLSTQLQEAKQDVEITAQFGKPELKDALTEQGADLEVKRADLLKRAEDAEAVAAEKEKEAAQIRKGIAELMSAWQGALEAAMSPMKAALSLKQQAVEAAGNGTMIPDNTADIKAKLQEVQQAVKEYMEQEMKERTPTENHNPEEYILPAVEDGDVNQMVAVLDKKAILVDAFHTHRTLRELAEQLDHTELLARLQEKLGKMNVVVQKSRELRIHLGEVRADLERANAGSKALTITRSVAPKIEMLRDQIKEAETMENDARERAAAVSKSLQSLKKPVTGGSAKEVEKRAAELSRLQQQADTCEDPGSAFCVSITEEYETARRKYWMLKRERDLEEEVNEREREHRVAVSNAARSQTQYKQIQKEVDQLKEKMGSRSKRKSDAVHMERLEVRLQKAGDKMWTQMAEAANITTSVQQARSALHAMRAVLRVRSNLALPYQKKLFELEGMDVKYNKVNAPEIQKLLKQVGALNKLADDAYRSSVERKERESEEDKEGNHTSTDLGASKGSVEDLEAEVAELYDKADATGSEELRAHYSELARSKKSRVAQMKEQSEQEAQMKELAAVHQNITHQLKKLQADSMVVQGNVANLQRSLQVKVADIRGKAALRMREPMLEKIQRVALKRDATSALTKLTALGKARQEADEKVEITLQPLWFQIAMYQERGGNADTIAEGLKRVMPVLTRILETEQRLLRPTRKIVEQDMIGEHEQAAAAVSLNFDEVAGQFRGLKTKVRQLEKTLKAETAANAGMAPEKLDMLLVDLKNELGRDTLTKNRVENDIWMANKENKWWQDKQVKDFEAMVEEKQAQVTKAAELRAEQLGEVAKQVCTSIGEMWHKTTMDDVDAQIESTEVLIREAQKNLAEWSMGIILPTPAPTGAPTGAPTELIPRKSPVEWEAVLQKHDEEFKNKIIHENEKHLDVATKVISKEKRGQQPIPQDAAEAAALAKDADEAARIALANGNGLNPDKLPLLSKVGVPPAPDVEPPEPEMPPPPPDPVEAKAAVVEEQAVHVEHLNAQLANLTKLQAPSDPIEYMKHDAEMDRLQKEITTETAQLTQVKQELKDLEGSKELNEARKLMKNAMLKANAYKKQFSEYASKSPVNKYALDRIQDKLSKSNQAFHEAKEVYSNLVSGKMATTKSDVRKETEILEEIESEVRGAAAVGNKKLEAEKQGEANKLKVELADKKKQLARLAALAKLMGAPESPPGMYYWPNAQEQRDLEIKSASALHKHMKDNIERLQGVLPQPQSADTEVKPESTIPVPGSQLDEAPSEDIPDDEPPDQASQWQKVKTKLEGFFDKQLARMMGMST
jgi:chromosome segregation ATPase